MKNLFVLSFAILIAASSLPSQSLQKNSDSKLRVSNNSPFFEPIPDQSIIAGDNGRYIKTILGKISGTKVKGYLYNPRNGSSTFIGVIDNTGLKEFTPPGNKKDGNDWVLVIDDNSKNFQIPGQSDMKNSLTQTNLITI